MGFWIRLGAWIIDVFVLWVISAALSALLFFVALIGDGGVGVGSFVVRVLLTLLLPWLYYWLFTGLKGQTPGKMLVRIRVVDAHGDIPGLGRAALREVPGKIISTIAFFLGFLWIGWDGQKQGWRDKIAGTLVVRARR